MTSGCWIRAGPRRPPFAHHRIESSADLSMVCHQTGRLLPGAGTGEGRNGRGLHAQLRLHMHRGGGDQNVALRRASASSAQEELRAPFPRLTRCGSSRCSPRHSRSWPASRLRSAVQGICISRSTTAAGGACISSRSAIEIQACIGFSGKDATNKGHELRPACTSSAFGELTALCKRRAESWVADEEVGDSEHGCADNRG